MARGQSRRWVPSPARAAARAWRYLPTARKAPLWRVAFAPLDLVDRMRGRGTGVPPRWLQHLVGGNYRGVGHEFAGHLVDIGGLRPSDRVLDIGCGSGRMALPLTSILGPAGSYEGFDVVPEAIAWCRSHITPRHPSFRFQVIDVRNDRYNPTGRLSAAEARFPYGDHAFDFAFATSLFTHLGRAEAENYLREASRVLCPGGRLLATFFLLDAEALAAIEDGRADLDFAHVGDGLRTLRHRPDDSDFAVAFDRELVLDAMERTGLRVVGDVHVGRWCGRERYTSYQDIVVARKPGEARIGVREASPPSQP